MNIWLSSLRIRAHLSWRTEKHLHVLHVLRTYPTCSYPGYQDTTTYAALPSFLFYWNVCCKAERLKSELTFLQNNVLTLVSVASAWKILTFHCLTKTSNKNKLNSGRRATGRTERWKADFLQDLKYEYIRHYWARHTRCWEGKGLVLCNFSMDRISIACPQNADMSWDWYNRHTTFGADAVVKS